MWLSIPLGYLLGSVIGDLVIPRAAILVGSCIAIAGVLASLRVPDVAPAAVDGMSADGVLTDVPGQDSR